MSFLFAALLLLAAPVQSPSFDSLLDGVQTWFARTNDFSADFRQISQDNLNRSTDESGRLFLKRERMMRWEYKTPRGDKLFISDGKMVYFYVAADKTVNRDPVKEVFDERMPMLFLLGRSNLRDEFSQFRERTTDKPITAGDRVVSMTPKKKSEIEEITMEVDPVAFRLHRLVVRRSDGNRSEFRFSNIDDKTKRDAKFFEFRVPPGVEVVDGI